MKKQRTKLDPRLQLGVALALPLVLAAAGWLLLVGPQRSKAASVAAQVAAAQDQYTVRTHELLHAPKPPPIRVADLFGLVRAMPDRQDMPGIILELDRVAGDAGISFDSIQPESGVVAATAYQVKKIDLGFSGNYYGLSDFLYRLRSLVSVRGGKLAAQGRLFSVEHLTFGQGTRPFPQIQAKLTVDAYVYGAAPTDAPPVAPASTDTTATTTTATTTTTTETTPAPTAAPAPAGVNG